MLCVGQRRALDASFNSSLVFSFNSTCGTLHLLLLHTFCVLLGDLPCTAVSSLVGACDMMSLVCDGETVSPW